MNTLKCQNRQRINLNAFKNIYCTVLRKNNNCAISTAGKIKNYIAIAFKTSASIKVMTKKAIFVPL